MMDARMSLVILVTSCWRMSKQRDKHTLRTAASLSRKMDSTTLISVDVVSIPANAHLRAQKTLSSAAMTRQQPNAPIVDNQASADHIRTAVDRAGHQRDLGPPV